MSRPPIWVKAHPRRPPERPAEFIAIHAQLAEAWQRDQHLKQLAEDLAHELDLDLSGLRVGGERT